ncbi:unnamed protein product [Urochloa humidicola]
MATLAVGGARPQQLDRGSLEQEGRPGGRHAATAGWLLPCCGAACSLPILGLTNPLIPNLTGCQHKPKKTRNHKSLEEEDHDID